MTGKPALHENLSCHPKVRHFDRSAQREVEKPPYFSLALARLHPRRTNFCATPRTPPSAGTSRPREVRS